MASGMTIFIHYKLEIKKTDSVKRINKDYSCIK